MTKPTGRPRGRPKTKEYVTLMARVPDDLADRARRYAGRKRQTISDVLRDGLLVLLEEEEPSRQFVYDMNTEADIASDMKDYPDITSDMIGGKVLCVPPIMSDRKKANASMLSDIKQDSPYIASDTKKEQAAIVSDAIQAFDPEKYILGKLCPRAHDYHGTGKTLLKRTNRHCMACDREKFHERKQTKKAK